MYLVVLSLVLLLTMLSEGADNRVRKRESKRDGGQRDKVTKRLGDSETERQRDK